MRPMDNAASSKRLREALFESRSAFVGIAFLSCVVNVLYLTGSIFMLEVYDRVIPSRSIPTLVGLSVLALALYGFQGVLDLLRARVLVRIGAYLDSALAPRVFAALVRLPLTGSAGRDSLQPLRDLDQVR